MTELKGKTEITLISKEGEKIIVKSPAKVKMGFFQTLMELRFGLPPFDVTPIDWKGLVQILVPFLFLIGYPALSEGIHPFFWFLALGLLAYNFQITRMYFFSYFRKKLTEGYKVETSEHEELLEAAGVLPLPDEESRRKNRKIGFGIMGALALCALFVMFAGSDSRYINMVKGGSMTDYPGITMEEAFDDAFMDPEWEYIAADDGDYVNVSGWFSVYDEAAYVVIQYKIIGDENFIYNAMEIDGEAQDDYMYSMLMVSIYDDM